MRRLLWILGLMLTISINGYAASPWGADYFPNVPLTTHEGKTVHFFQDLIKDKVVVINFIYTSCPDTCPLETAQLTRVQRILGDRLGKDIFFYSITIDPDTDTVAALKAYREKFGAKWTFLTGNEQDITQLRRKLGLFIEEIQDGSNNHNVNMIIGNQKTGRWMKRSPFENPYVLADQIGNWLTNWKAPQHIKDFANAPQLRNISDGEKLFRTRCVSCHTIDGRSDTSIGPDLLYVTQRRDRPWLVQWLRAPDKMLENRDPTAMALYQQYNNIAMPNLRLSPVDIADLLKYMQQETDQHKLQMATPASKPSPAIDSSDHVGEITIKNAWVRAALEGVTTNAAYMTIVNNSKKDMKLLKVESSVCKDVEIHEMRITNGMMDMRELNTLLVPAGDQVQLKPGGMHLMFNNTNSYLATGHKVELTLVFDSGKKYMTTADVVMK